MSTRKSPSRFWRLWARAFAGVGIIEELSFTTVRRRLILWILRRSRTEGATFALGANQQELSAEIGTVRELVSRNLTRLQAQGFIAISGRELRIIDPAGLEAELALAVKPGRSPLL